MTEVITRAYALRQAAWWQRQAAREHEKMYPEQDWLINYSRPGFSDARKTSAERIHQHMRQHRIAHATARDYLELARILS